MSRALHDWQGDDFEVTCTRCKLIRCNYDGIPGYAYLGWQTGNVWRHRVHQTPPCGEGPP